MKNPVQPSVNPSAKPWFNQLQTTVGNTIKFQIRRLTKKKRGIRTEHRESKKGLFINLARSEQKKTLDQALRLKKIFHLDNFWENTSRENLRFNLFYIEMLDRALTLSAPRLPDIIEAADVGCSNWPYIQGLHAAIKWWRSPAGRQLQITGFEEDPYRVNPDYYSCFDHAQGHMSGLMDVKYLPKRFKRQINKFHLITLILPFVFLQDHLDWELPPITFNPNKLLRDAWKSLKPGGVLIIINQGREEHLAQREIMLTEEIDPLVSFPHESILYDFEPLNHVLVSVKDSLQRM